MALLVEFIFLITFYGLYFNHQLHIRLYNICYSTVTCKVPSKLNTIAPNATMPIYIFQPYMRERLYAVPASTSTMYQSANWIEQIAVAIQIRINSINYFHWKILALAGICTWDLPGTPSTNWAILAWIKHETTDNKKWKKYFQSQNICWDTFFWLNHIVQTRLKCL